MAGVPDTASFSLQDVVDVIPGAQASLQDCFDDANADFFDPVYQGSKDSLLDFRNYGGSAEVWYSYDAGYGDGDVDYSNVVWATCRGAVTGDNVDTSGSWIVQAEYDAVDYFISRGFMRFDLSAIPVTATCEEAGIGIDVLSTDGASAADYKVVVLIGTQNDSLAVEDFDAFTFDDIIMSDYDESPGDDFEVYNTAIKASGGIELGKIEDAFGGYLYVAVVNSYYDNDNNTPSAINGIEFFRSGEVDDFPGLRLVITI